VLFITVLSGFLCGLDVLCADEVVREAQTKLFRGGYYEGQIDGQWGSQTAAAVRRYQIARSLKVTGELNRETLDALGVTARPAPTSISRAAALADLFVGGPFLSASPEQQIRAVRQAQENLKLLGYYRGPIDGNPSTTLEDALKAYQKGNRFRPTGRLDKTTLQALDLVGTQ
jgi:peptidoglycan hydrolase-like protein with peptidoglycan-binding domain